MQITKPYFTALKGILKSSLPSDEFNQVMEESLWEFDSLNPMAWSDKGKKLASLIRTSSICVSFFRAMTKVGINPGIALDSMDRAGDSLDWTPVPETTSAKCSIANYFQAKDALDLCRVTFCKSCPEFGKGCKIVESLLKEPTTPAFAKSVSVPP